MEPDNRPGRVQYCCLTAQYGHQFRPDLTLRVLRVLGHGAELVERVAGSV